MKQDTTIVDNQYFMLYFLVTLMNLKITDGTKADFIFAVYKQRSPRPRPSRYSKVK
jgi:hypothetical protein